MARLLMRVSSALPAARRSDRPEAAERIVGFGVAQPSARVALVDVDIEIAAVVVPEPAKQAREMRV
jgi:hypothetical protein